MIFEESEDKKPVEEKVPSVKVTGQKEQPIRKGIISCVFSVCILLYTFCIDCMSKCVLYPVQMYVYYV